jgi:hypothetical protein
VREQSGPLPSVISQSEVPRGVKSSASSVHAFALAGLASVASYAAKMAPFKSPRLAMTLEAARNRSASCEDLSVAVWVGKSVSGR